MYRDTNRQDASLRSAYVGPLSEVYGPSDNAAHQTYSQRSASPAVNLACPSCALQGLVVVCQYLLACPLERA